MMWICNLEIPLMWHRYVHNFHNVAPRIGSPDPVSTLDPRPPWTSGIQPWMSLWKLANMNANMRMGLVMEWRTNFFLIRGHVLKPWRVVHLFHSQTINLWDLLWDVLEDPARFTGLTNFRGWLNLQEGSRREVQRILRRKWPETYFCGWEVSHQDWKTQPDWLSSNLCSKCDDRQKSPAAVQSWGGLS